MKLTKEKLRLIIKEEVEKLDLDEADFGYSYTGPTGEKHAKGHVKPSTPEEAPASGGETTMEIGVIEDIKSRLVQLIAQSGNQIVGRPAMALKMLDKALQAAGLEGEFMQARATPSQRRKKARAVGTTGKGSAAGVDITGKLASS